MALTNKLCSKFCEELLEKRIIPDGNILNYQVFYDENCKDVTVKISTEEDEYTFTVNLIQNDKVIVDEIEKSNQFLNILNNDENTCIGVRSISISEYDRFESGSTDAASLKYVLRFLALKHAKSIKLPRNYSLTRPSFGIDSNETENILFEAIDEIQNVDKLIFKDGVRNLLNQDSSNHENIVYVPSYPLQNQLVFQSTKFSRCKVINTGHQTTFPLVYDVLLTIFYLSNQTLRQHHFHELVEYYYHTLEKKLHNFGVDLSSVLSVDDYEKQIKYFLPFVKLACLLKHTSITQSNLKCLHDKTMVLELYDCFLYSNLSREDCYKIVKNKMGSINYKFLSWSMKQLEERPGFLGDYFKLNIKIEVNGEVNHLNLFTKYLPTTNEVVQDMALASFEKEVFFYNTFMSELKSLGLDELLTCAPKCYFSRLNDVIIFEDLSMKNYKTFDKTKPFSYDNMIIVIRQLAKLHACSLLYEEKMTEKCGKTVRIDDEYNKYLKEINLLIDETNSTSRITICGVETTMKYTLDAFPDILTNMTMETFKNKVSSGYDSSFQKVKKCDRFRNVICQGDIWASNILFQMKDDSPVDCCLIDYQLIRYCPPTHDLFFLLYVTTDKGTRSKYMEKLVEEYYSQLRTIIEKYNFDMDKIYTYEQFLECCEYMKPAAIWIASLYTPVVMCPSEKIQDILTDGERAHLAFSVDRKEMVEGLYHEGPYRQRVREIVEDMYAICEANAF